MENQSFIVCSSSIISIIKTQSFDSIFMTIISINPYSIKLNYLIPSLITLYFTIVWCYSIIWKSIIKTYYLTFIWLFNFFDLFWKICYNVLFEFWNSTFFFIIWKAMKAVIEAIFLKLICWLFSMLITIFKNSCIWYFQYVLSVNQVIDMIIFLFYIFPCFCPWRILRTAAVIPDWQHLCPLGYMALLSGSYYPGVCCLSVQCFCALSSS